MRSPLQSPWRVLILALALGIAADQLFFGRWFGVSVPLFVLAGLAALGWLSWAEQRPPTRANMWIAALALVFAGFIVLRDAPALVFFNLIALVGLLVLLVANYRGPALLRLTPLRATWDVIRTSIVLGFEPILLAVQAAQAMPVQRGRLGAVAPLARGLVLAAPVVLVFAGLLGAADSVFASYVSDLLNFQIPFDMEDFTRHAISTLVVAWFCAGGMTLALAAVPAPAPDALPSEGDTQRLGGMHVNWRILGSVEALTVLVLVDLLFGAFMLVQGAYFFGGLDTLARTEMTYADYARRGFFELVVVACLALAMLWVLSVVTRREQVSHRRAFNAACVAMVVLVIGMLVSAFQRMLLYESAYGFTQLRVYTHSFMVWLAVVLVLFVVALLRERQRVFVFGGVASALALLAVLNLANPDALIVRANMARYTTSGSTDIYYFSQLSADAIPAMVEALDQLPFQERSYLGDILAEKRADLVKIAEQQGWPAWSLARARGVAAIPAEIAR